MGERSAIEWTDRTWNPMIGCSRISAGCGVADAGGCYAERFTHRFAGPGQRWEGLTRATANGPRWTGAVRLFEAALTLPLRWRKPSRIFVNSMSDLFHENVDDAWVDRTFAVMALAPQHVYQVLTKRPARMLEYCSNLDPERLSAAADADFGDEGGVRVANWINGWSRPRVAPDDGNPLNGTVRRWPLPNVWLGVSVEDQATADARIPLLLQTPAAVRFVSYEPALGPVDFAGGRRWFQAEAKAQGTENAASLDWVIVGGESGPGARPFDVAWARSTIQQCRDAGVACFTKQLGAAPINVLADRCDEFIGINDRKGGDWSEWPEDLRVREFPR